MLAGVLGQRGALSGGSPAAWSDGAISLSPLGGAWEAHIGPYDGFLTPKMVCERSSHPPRTCNDEPERVGVRSPTQDFSYRV